MQCPACDTSNPDSSRFCDACGSPLEVPCPACGHGNRPGAKFCGACGRPLTAAPAEPRPAAENEPSPLPAPLAAHLRSRFAREGERKLVTVLFADIRDSTALVHELDPEQAMVRLEPGLRAMAAAVHQYGGTVNRILGDGIMALFGAPLAYEDHAVRACLASQAMIEAVSRLRELSVEIRVGLNSGEVVVRSIGHDLSMEYDAVGPTTHLANRMEQLAAPGTACMTPRTARLVRGFIEVRSRGPAEIKGLTDPIDLFEMVGAVSQSRWQARAASQTLTPFVGRETELRIMADALGRARTGRGQVVAISGEAGMGKSRLVHEFLADPLLAGLTVLSGAATPHDLKAPYQLLGDMLRTWLDIEERDGHAAIAGKLAGAMAGLATRPPMGVAPFRALLDLPAGDSGWDALDPARRRQQTHDALRWLISRLARTGPCLVVCEDLHWADAESQAAVEYLVDGLARTAASVIVTCRPESETVWGRHGHSSLIRLKPLEAEASDALLCRLLGDGAELQALRSRVVHQTDGTPLFLEEMARSLVDTGVLTSEPTRFRLTRDVDEVVIPESVQVVLATRIDRLPAEERALLQIASVIGKDVPLTLLQAVASVPAEQLHRQLAELRAQEFLFEAGDSFGAEFSFKHALTHSVAYDSMLLRRRRALHAGVLAAIEQHFPERSEEYTERLADHALRGENWDKAVAYALAAGQRANARSAHHTAILFFHHALDALDRLPTGPERLQQGIDVRLGLRVALAATGDLVDVHRHMEDAEALARAAGDERQLMPITISRAIILSNLGDLQGAVRTGQAGRELAERFGDEACFVSSGYALGQAHWNAGEFAASGRALVEAIDRMTNGGRDSRFGTTGGAPVLCLVSLSHTHALTGDRAASFARARQALDVATEAGRPYDESYARAAMGLAHLTCGDLDEAIRELEEAARVAQENGIVLLLPHAARYLGRAYALAGRLAEADTVLSAAFEQSRFKSLRALHGWCAATLGLVRSLQDQPAEAEALFDEALTFARGQGYRPLAVHALRLHATHAARTGAAELAEERLRQAAAGAQALGMKPEWACCRQELGHLLGALGRERDGREELAAAADLFRACGITGPAAMARLRLPFGPRPAVPSSS